MKKVLSFFLVVVLVLISLPIGGMNFKVFAAGTYENFDYDYDMTNGGIAIKKYRENYSNKSAVIPEYIDGLPVTSISSYAFYYCTNITDVTIPKTVMYIYEKAFSNCRALATVSFPDEIKYIATDAFENTAWYNNQSDGVVYAGKMAYKYKGTCPSYVSIKSGTVRIGDSLFSGCTALTSVGLSSGIKYIGSEAFYGCTGLKSITLPSGVKGIGNSAFRGCQNLATISFPNTLVDIGVSAFSGTAWFNSQTDDVIYAGKVCLGYKYKDAYSNMPETVYLKIGTLGIADGAFSFGSGYSSVLKSITLPDGLKHIGDSAFKYCTNLTQINIPDSVESFGVSTFQSCYKLTEINIPMGVSRLESDVFYNCGFTEVVVPDSVEYIGASAFSNCADMKKITLSKNLKVLASYALCACHALEELELPESLMIIDYMAIDNCIKLKEITVPENVQYIGRCAFSAGVFEKIDVDGDNPYFCSINGVVFSKDKTELMVFPTHYPAKTYTVPSTVEIISEDAFYGANVEEIILPQYLTEIGATAFSYSKIKSIKIPNYVRDIYQTTFQGCRQLEKIEFSSAPFTIDFAAFANCTALTDVYFNGTQSMWDSIEIDSYNNDALTSATLHLHSQTKGYFGEWKNKTAPTCTASGIKYRKCSGCGKYEEKNVDATGHNYGEIVVDKAPTCTQSGSGHRVCTACKAVSSSESIAATGHNYGEWIVQTAATCTVSGTKYQKCKVCSTTKTQTITAAHKYFGENCVVCGEKDIATVESAHNYANNTNKSWSVSRNNAAYMILKFSADTETESGCDWIYILDDQDNQIGKYSGATLASKTVTVNGTSVTIKLSSDVSVTKYGFKAEVQTVYNPHQKGDINYDAMLGAADLGELKKLLLGDSKDSVADVNGDGKINVLDLIRLKKLLVS